MGGSGGGPFRSTKPETLKSQIRKAEKSADNAAFETALSDSLGQLLSKYNDRDVELVNSRLEDIKACIEDEIEGTVDSLFGGSVAKHTYVDGLSDVDSLLVVNDCELYQEHPGEIVREIADMISNKVDNVSVTAGRIAVTVEYDDGMILQFLPAINDGNETKVLSWKGDSWSQIDPNKFRAALTKRNQECNGKLIPLIKLVKAINSNLPDNAQLSGYHVESLAISAFSGYDGQTNHVNMLPHFFDKAKDLVLKPMKDKSGQSVHVDDYLGGENSMERQRASHILNRIGRRMMNASASRSQEQWLSLFGDD